LNVNRLFQSYIFPPTEVSEINSCCGSRFSAGYIKGKIFFPLHDMKANGRVELQLYTFLISALDTGKWLTIH
jgi:hypothetical protein